MPKMCVARSTRSAVSGWLRKSPMFTPSVSQTCTAYRLGGWPRTACTPAEATSMSLRLPSKRRNNPSAIGLRQILPVQTKRTLFTISRRACERENKVVLNTDKVNRSGLATRVCSLLPRSIAPAGSSPRKTLSERSMVGRFRESGKSAPSALLRTSIYCAALAGVFLYLALARHEPLYSIGIFAMFVLYLAIRIYSARRILGQYEPRIAELEARLHKIEGDKSTATEKEPTAYLAHENNRAD